MAKAVLISIRPEWCEKIASGQKTIEVRKNRPKLDTPFKCYLYCTKPNTTDPHEYLEIHTDDKIHKANGKVIGEFICDSIEEFESEFYSDDSVFNAIYRVVEDEDYPDVRLLTAIASNEDDSENFWICTQSCLSFDEIKEYVGYDKSEKTFYGWHISDLVIYDKPKELREFSKYWDYFIDNQTPRPPQSWCYVEELK